MTERLLDLLHPATASKRLMRLGDRNDVEELEVIRGILGCLGMGSRAPPLTPAASPGPTDQEPGFEEPWPCDEPGADA